MKLEDRKSEHGSRRVETGGRQRERERDALAAFSHIRMTGSELDPNKPPK